MGKSNFLLVDLNEKRTKKLAETITSDTSRKILNYLTEKEDSEANMAKELEMPISTVHYHLQKLQEAKLVVVEEYHYSQKGREVNHYKLANKYIIIAPKNVTGLRERLKGILPVGLVILGLSAIIKVGQTLMTKSGTFTSEGSFPVMEAAMDEAVPRVAEIVQEVAQIPTTSPDIALWFLVGSLVTIFLYLLIGLIKEKIKKN